MSENLESVLVHAASQTVAPTRWLAFPTLLAVSGGADSVALLRLFASIRQRSQQPDSRLIVAHVNHGLRAESDQEAEFVRGLAQDHGLEFQTTRFESCHGASEESLREQRYRWLMDIAAEQGARYLATGHTLDDQVETVLFRILRGTGICGLAGIPAVRAGDRFISIFRPLLSVRRGQIEDYLAQLAQPFRDDKTNFESQYTRNFLRNELMPVIRERFGDSADESISRLGFQAREVDDYLNRQIQPLLEAVRYQAGGNLQIDCEKISGQPRILLRQLLNQIWQEMRWPRQSMTLDWFQKICDLLVEQTTTVRILNLPSSIRVEKRGQTLSISDQRDPKSESTELDPAVKKTGL